jgi:hypothetical protein
MNRIGGDPAGMSADFRAIAGRVPHDGGIPSPPELPPGEKDPTAVDCCTLTKPDAPVSKSDSEND